VTILSFKIVYIGDPAVGKTTLRRRFLGKAFNERYDPTIGVDISTYTMNISNYTLRFSLFDLAGQFWFKDVRSEVYRGAHGAFVVFDVTNYTSFYNVANWIREYWRNTERGNPFILIGNKIDLADMRVVSRRVIDEYLQVFLEKTGYKVDYIETSAKTGVNVKEAFKLLVKKIARFKKGR